MSTKSVTARPPRRRSLAKSLSSHSHELSFALMERVFAADDFRGCPFVNAVAEVGESNHAARRVAVQFKEQQRVWFRDLLLHAKAPDPDGLAMQLMLLVDGAIATALVRKDPKVARLARDAARILLAAAKVR